MKGSRASFSSAISTGDAVVREFGERRKTYRDCLKASQKKPIRKTVHELRVSIRKLLAATEALARVGKRKKAGKIGKQLKSQLDLLGPLRDIHIQIKCVKQMASRHSELQPAVDILRQRERKLTHRARRKLRDAAPHQTVRACKSLAKDFEKKWCYSKQETLLRHRLSSRLRESFRDVESRASAVDRTIPATVHQLRVAFKSFRYLVEYLKPLLQTADDHRFKTMGVLQKRMGKIQDLRVISHTLYELISTKLIDPDKLTAIAWRLLARQGKLIAAFHQGLPQRIRSLSAIALR